MKQLNWVVLVGSPLVVRAFLLPASCFWGFHEDTEANSWGNSNRILQVCYDVHVFSSCSTFLLQWNKLYGIWFANFSFCCHHRLFEWLWIGTATRTVSTASTTVPDSCVSTGLLLIYNHQGQWCHLAPLFRLLNSWVEISAPTSSDNWIDTVGMLVCIFREENTSTRNKSCL